MPATEVSPALRRRISDDARELLHSAFESLDLDPPPSRPTTTSVDDTSSTGGAAFRLEQRLQNFRGRLRLELLADDSVSDDDAVLSALELRLAVSATTFLARYHVEPMGAEVSVANRAGVSTSWITLADGRHRQLQEFLDDPAAPLDAVKGPIRSLLAMLDLLDLLDLFAACASAVPVRSVGGRSEFYAVGDKNSYVFAFDRASGHPTSITLAPLQSSGGAAAKLRLVVERYTRFSGAIDVPSGVKSDVQLMVDTSMACYARWSGAGQDEQQAARIAGELARRWATARTRPRSSPFASSPASGSPCSPTATSCPTRGTSRACSPQWTSSSLVSRARNRFEGFIYFFAYMIEKERGDLESA